MIKKIFSSILTLSLLSSLIINVKAADSFKIEAENYSYASTPVTITNNGELSNSKYVRIFDYPTNAGFTLGYTFEVKKSGVYDVRAVGSDMDKVYTSDWDIYMNTPDNSAMGKTIEQHLNINSIKDVMKLFNFGQFRLKKGKNTLYVTVNCEDLQAANMVVCYLDYFLIEQANKGEFSVSGVSFKGSDNGVFTEDESIGINLEFTTVAPQRSEFDFKVVDGFGRTVIKDTAIATSGMETLTVNIGKQKPGWYRVYVYNKGEDKPLNSYTAFSVTHSMSKRAKFSDVAFASDLAAEYDSGTMKRANSFAKAMKYSGFDWIRSRGMGKNTTEAQLKMKKAIADAGINTVEVMGTAVGTVSDDNDTMFINDLYKSSYSLWKDYPTYEEGNISMVEVFNELDISKTTPGADLYSAYFKAAAIGLADSGYRPYVSHTGLAMYSGLYFDLLMQNETLKYSDVYNFHAHAQLDSRVSSARQYSDVYSETAPTPLYLTEAGIYQITEDGDVLSDDQMRESARYGITSAVECLSYGTDKHFWFLGRPYIENAGNYASFHAWSYYPYSVYSSVENMTYQLGEGIYKGEVLCDADGVKGMLFDRGTGEDVAVFWSEQPTYISINANEVIYADMYGYEERKIASDGKVEVSVSQDPIYIRFNGRWNTENYYPVAHNKTTIDHKTLAVNDRIVIQPLWQDVNLNDVSVKNVGYSLTAGKNYNVKAAIYNFNNETVDVNLGAMLASDNQYNLELDNNNLTIGPWGKAIVNVKLNATKSATPGKAGELKIYGTLADGRQISPSISAYNISLRGVELDDSQVQKFQGYCDAKNWDLTNIQESGSLAYSSNPENESFTMQATFTSTSTWYFPKLKVEDASFIKGSSGISFDRICSDNSVDTTTVFVYLKDGREYYSGAASGVPFTDNLETLTYPWSTFSLFKSPLGNVDIREFDTDLIEYVAIGVSGGIPNKPATTILNFGVYTLDQEGGVLNPGKIEISGISHMAHYSKGEISTFYATLPNEELTDVKVLNHNNKYDSFTMNGSEIAIDVSNLERGKYEFKICAKNNMNYYYVSKIVFYID